MKVAETTFNINHHCCVSGDIVHILLEVGNVRLQKDPKLRPKLLKFNSAVDGRKKQQDSLQTTSVLLLKTKILNIADRVSDRAKPN